MQVLRAVLAMMSALAVSAACGSADDSEDNSIEALDPPPNINAEVCSSVAIPEDGPITPECSGCCTDNGFSGSTEYAGRCVCGNSLNDTGDTACADQSATLELCTTCCDSAGFTGHTWVGELMCTCHGRSDREVCAHTLQSSDPSQACRVCCLNSGYLGMLYVGIPPEECSCIEL